MSRYFLPKLSIEISIDTYIKNCFFLWCNLSIFILSSIPLFSAWVSHFYQTSMWTVPKIYELKMYVFFMFLSGFIAYVGLIYPKIFQKQFSIYQIFNVVFYPITVLLFSLCSSEFIRFLSVSLLSLSGLMIWTLDFYFEIQINNLRFKKYLNELILISVGLTIFLIIYFSSEIVFSFREIWLPLLGIFSFIMFYLKFTNLKNNFFLLLLPIFLFVVTFWSMDGIEPVNYSFFMGPVIEILYGHYHPFMLDIQYGQGLTTFLFFYFKLIGHISYENMQELLKVLTFFQYILVFFIASIIYQSRKLAFLILLTILFFQFYSINGWLYYMAPSIGFLRFGLIYIILTFYGLEQNKIITPKTTNICVALFACIAFYWSFESAVYTFPAICVAEYMNRNLKHFLFNFCILFLLLSVLYFSPILLQGKWPELWRFYEYAMIYKNGFGQIPLNRLTNFWWLFPLLYAYFLIRIITGEITNKIIIALTIYGAALFTYFGGRAHPAALMNLTIPFILLSAYFILNLKLESKFLKDFILACSLLIFFSVNNVLYPGIELKILWGYNIPLIENSYKAFLTSINNPTLIVNKKINCADFKSMNRYIKDNSIAILSDDNETLFNLYQCTKTHNAFLANSFYEMALNPDAVNRALSRLPALTNRYILVDTNLLDNKYFPLLHQTADKFLKKLAVKKVDQFKLNKQTIVVFQSNEFKKIKRSE